MKRRDRERVRKLRARLTKTPPTWDRNARPARYPHVDSEENIDGVLERVWILTVEDPMLGQGWHVAGLITQEDGKPRLVIFNFPPVSISEHAAIAVAVADGERDYLLNQAEVTFNTLMSATSPLRADGVRSVKLEVHDIDGNDDKAELAFAGYPWAHLFGVAGKAGHA